MRKCVSMVAVASATLGLTACSATDRGRELAAAQQPLSAHAEAGTQAGGHAAAVQVHAAPVAVAPAPTAKGQNQQVGSGAHAAIGAAVAPGAASSATPGPVGAPVLIPSSTTDVPAQTAHPHTVAARSAATAPALAPAPPRPAPPPSAPDPSPYDPNASPMAQIMDAVAAAHMDGKPVLLVFGANWCTACKALDKAMHTPKAQAVLAQYHVVHIDLGDADPAHLALATQYDAIGTFGMPLLVVLNPDGTVRADSAHVGQPKYDEASLAAWLNQWAR